MHKSRLTLLAMLVATGCNTCLDASRVPLAESPNVVSDTGADTGPGGGDASVLDMGCSPRADQDICAEIGRNCGEVLLSECGQEQLVLCGECGEGGTCSDDGVCQCEPGYDFDELDCVDIDECARGLDNCPAEENCTNLPGSFQCSSCPPGTLDVDGDGTVCEDIDECENGTAGCDELVECTNLEPGFICGDCPAGYEDVGGDGTECVDIDECDLGLDNCGQTDCTNTPGSYTCACPRGTKEVADTCEPVVVVDVTQHTLTLAPGVASTTMAVPADAVAEKLVPFATVRGSANGDDLSDLLTDVWVDTSTGQIRAERNGTQGTVVVELSLVEFGSPSVASSTFSITGTTTTPIPLVLTDGRSFPVFSYRGNNINRHRDRGMVELVPSGPNAGLRRGDSTGGVAGHLYVVTANMDEFVTSDLSLTFSDGQTCDQRVHGLGDVSKAFLLRSHQTVTTDEPTINAYDTQIRCELRNSDVDCCREVADGTDDITIDATVFVVQFNATSDGFVQRADLSLPDANPIPIGIATTAPLDRSMAIHGANGGIGATAMSMGAHTNPVSFATVRINSPNQIEVQRGQTSSADTLVNWEVVKWPLLPR